MSLITAPTLFPGMNVAARAAGPVAAAAAATSTTKVQVLTSLANLKTVLAGLHNNIKNIASIKVSDSGTLSFSATEMKLYGDVIGKISDNRDLSATGVDMASLQTIAKNKNVKTIAISDSTANIQDNMGLLIANNTKIAASGITRTDPTSKLNITDKNYTQAIAAGGVLSKMGTLTGILNITGLAVSQLTARVADSNVNTVSIADKSSNIVGAAASLTTNIAKVNTVNVTAVVLTTLSTAAYTAFKSNTALTAKINATNPNALRNAFNVTGVTVANSYATGTLSMDNNVKSIGVSDTTGAAPAVLTMSTKVAKVALELTAAQLTNTKLTDIVALGNKLSSVKITDQAYVSLDASKIQDKATASALTKMTGNTDSPLNVRVTNAKLSDVSGLIANKQVTDANISDNVANLLAFSSDAFAALPTSSNVTITLKDTATNLGANATALAAAIAQYGQQKQIIKLQINDTAANLGANINGLETVADAITGATTPDLLRIEINQIDSSGVADSNSLVKVSFAQYTSDSNMLAYIKADTSNAKGVEIDAGIDNAGINNAKNIGFQLQVAQSVLHSGTPPLPTSATGAGTVAPTADVTKLDKYSDVAKVNITFSTAAAYTNYANAADTDIAGYTVGINILA